MTCLQAMLKALDTHMCVDVYYERRAENYLTVMHNPFHSQTRHNVADWHSQIHSKVGFRYALSNLIQQRLSTTCIPWSISIMKVRGKICQPFEGKVGII